MRTMSRRGFFTLLAGAGGGVGLSGLTGAAASQPLVKPVVEREVNGTIIRWLGRHGHVRLVTGKELCVREHQLPRGIRVKAGDRVRVLIKITRVRRHEVIKAAVLG